MRSALFALGLSAFVASPALATEDCPGRVVWSAPRAAGDVAAGWPLGPGDTPQWGKDTAAIVAGASGPEIVTRFPRGSINPGNPDAPEGGAGFLDRFARRYEAGCLTYEVRFDDGFDFGQGGKLPGLFGGKHTSGCTPDRNSGFSTRYMWGRHGTGFLYPYFASRDTPCGGMIGLGRFHFTPGTWHRITQKVRLNSDHQPDGEVDIWFDGVLVVEETGLEIRADPSVEIEGVMFATFFGGSDPSRASPADQSMHLRNFRFLVEDLT